MSAPRLTRTQSQRLAATPRSSDTFVIPNERVTRAKSQKLAAIPGQSEAGEGTNERLTRAQSRKLARFFPSETQKQAPATHCDSLPSAFPPEEPAGEGTQNEPPATKSAVEFPLPAESPAGEDGLRSNGMALQLPQDMPRYFISTSLFDCLLTGLVSSFFASLPKQKSELHPKRVVSASLLLSY